MLYLKTGVPKTIALVTSSADPAAGDRCHEPVDDRRERGADDADAQECRGHLEESRLDMHVGRLQRAVDRRPGRGADERGADGLVGVVVSVEVRAILRAELAKLVRLLGRVDLEAMLLGERLHERQARQRVVVLPRAHEVPEGRECHDIDDRQLGDDARRPLVMRRTTLHIPS